MKWQIICEIDFFKKIYVLGDSWGILLGSYVVAENPELYHAYIGMGQIGNAFESEKEVYQFMMDNAGKIMMKLLF